MATRKTITPILPPEPCPEPTPDRPKGVGYLGAELVTYEIREDGHRVVLSPESLAGQLLPVR